MKYDIDAIQKVKNFIPQHELDIFHNFLLSQKKFKVKKKLLGIDKNQYLIDSSTSSHTVKKIRVIFC